MKKLLEQARAHAEQTELFYLETTSSSVEFANGMLKSTETSENRGVGIRMIRGGRLALAASSNLDALPDFLPQVARLCDHGKAVPYGFARPAELQPFEHYNPPVEQLDLEAWVAEGERIVARVREYDPHVLANCGFGAESSLVRVLNTNGLDCSYRVSQFNFDVVLQLVEGQNIVYVFENYRGAAPCADIAQRVEKVIADCELARKTVDFTPGKTDVIIAPSAMADIMLCIEQGVDGQNALKGTSPLCGEIGKQVLDERVTLVDDPLHPKGLESRPFDDEGTASRRTVLFDRGVFQGFLTDLDAAHGLQTDSTGNGLRIKSLLRSRHYAAGVSVAPTNLVLEPGDTPLKQMIAGIEHGLLIEMITGILLGNLVNGEFSGNVFLGYCIRDGKLVGRVKNAMISGNVYDAFREKLVALSRERKWAGNFGGTSGSYLLPWTHWREIDISG
jgi:PmbA protein